MYSTACGLRGESVASSLYELLQLFFCKCKPLCCTYPSFCHGNQKSISLLGYQLPCRVKKQYIYKYIILPGEPLSLFLNSTRPSLPSFSFRTCAVHGFRPRSARVCTKASPLPRRPQHPTLQYSRPSNNACALPPQKTQTDNATSPKTVQSRGRGRTAPHLKKSTLSSPIL